MYIPGFGDVSTPSALAQTLARSPGTAATERARAGILGPLANPLQGQGVPGLARAREGSTGQQVTDTGDGGDTVSRTFNPYPTTLPPLSPQMLAALEARRAASLRQLQEAEAQAESQRQQAELANVGRLLDIEETTGRERRQGLAELAGQGLARSPMFANPFRRELARQQQQQIAESQQTLANTLDQLGVALEAARQRRESELAQIAFETAQQRSSVPRLLGLE